MKKDVNLLHCNFTLLQLHNPNQVHEKYAVLPARYINTVLTQTSRKVNSTTVSITYINVQMRE